MSSTAFKTYDMVGVKEDISDVITNISPTNTPFQSLVKTESVHNTLFQWQEDSLAAVGANSAVEGADASFSTMTPTTMLSNYTQILTKAISVSGTADTISTYGRAKETAYQLGKKSAEVKRELEYALLGIAQNAAVGNETTARKFGNVWGTGATGANMIDAGNIIDHTATPVALSENDILTANQHLYEGGGEAKIMMIKPADSLIVATFTAAAGRYRTFDGSADKTVVNVVDLYVSPFGEQKVVINRFMKADRAFLFDPQYWKLAVLRPWTRIPLAVTGDAHKEEILGEFSLKHLNQKASAGIIGLTGSNPVIGQ
ncbi:SU10 major capsid protein [Burkholderia sp. DN3021]|uniref:SU10 major capsid protein n=1 Tax=Burkholderia sp. DN3021 TaxID=3410137 RepID=UPI003C7E04C7